MVKIKIFIRNIIIGIKNLYYWFPIIWNDRNWDQYYLYVILKHKLKKMEKYQRVHGITSNNEKTAKKIKLCVNLLDRIIKDDYIMNALYLHEKKWGEVDIKFTPIEDNEEYGELNIELKKETTQEEKMTEERRRLRLYKHSDYMKKQDIDMLFETMRKHVECWWD